MIAQTIQLALAPVFVLVAIGSIMNILSARLGRVVDRWRAMQPLYADTSGADHDHVVREIRSCDVRIKLIGRAFQLLVLSGLAIGLTVAAVFADSLIAVDLETAIGTIFVTAIALLMGALLIFLREIKESANALSIPKTYLELDREL